MDYILDTFEGESNDEEEYAELGSLTIIDDKLEDKQMMKTLRVREKQIFLLMASAEIMKNCNLSCQANCTSILCLDLGTSDRDDPFLGTFGPGMAPPVADLT